MSQMQDTLHAIMEATQAQDNERFLDFLTDDVEYHFHVSSPCVRSEANVVVSQSRLEIVSSPTKAARPRRPSCR